MKAFTRTRYGGPEVLQLEEMEKPSVKDDHLLIKVIANSANPADWHILRGKPFFARFTYGLFKPSSKLLGLILPELWKQSEGISATLRLAIGCSDRAFREVLMPITIKATDCGLIPNGVDFVRIAGVPLAGLTALQALITHGQLKAGETVLINGSTGGVGHFASCMAKAVGAKVTAVCSRKNGAFVKSLGADHVMAYDQESIHYHTGHYDLIVDTQGNLTHQDYQRMGKRGVMVGFTTMGQMLSLLVKRAFSSFPLTQFTAQSNPKDLETLASLMQQEKINVHIEKTYAYLQTPQAIRPLEAMRTKGKVVMV
jgi:NADPH:quinone reductase-like Zn-dependent oxidoreductase